MAELGHFPGNNSFWLFIISFFVCLHAGSSQMMIMLYHPQMEKVVVIEEVYDEEYFKDKRLQISIFMSPANVHQNRAPTSVSCLQQIS
jgi:phosphatidylserine decarboxylase